uniref:Uncharacterized protein n=1 Tax=Timema monikensis TaxID=170555 RepID=A0A7R9HV19_9NEOP|nr:unnamed protein product [Timema monikensis]
MHFAQFVEIWGHLRGFKMQLVLFANWLARNDLSRYPKLKPIAPVMEDKLMSYKASVRRLHALKKIQNGEATLKYESFFGGILWLNGRTYLKMDCTSSYRFGKIHMFAHWGFGGGAPNKQIELKEKSLKKKKFSSKLQLGVKRVMSSPTCTIKLGGYVFVGADDNYRPPHMSTTEKQSGTDENSSSEMIVYMGSYRDSHRDRVPFDNILDESKYNDNSTTEEETCMTLNDIQTIVKQTPPKSINVVSCHTCVALVKETATVHYISWEYVTVQHLESVHYSYVPHGVQTTIILMIVFLFIWLVFRAFSFILP